MDFEQHQVPAVVCDVINRLVAAKLAEKLEVSPWAVLKWKSQGVPPKRVLWLAEQDEWRTTPHELAPHLYPHPDDGLPATLRGKRRRASKAAA